MPNPRTVSESFGIQVFQGLRKCLWCTPLNLRRLRQQGGESKARHSYIMSHYLKKSAERRSTSSKCDIESDLPTRGRSCFMSLHLAVLWRAGQKWRCGDCCLWLGGTLGCCHYCAVTHVPLTPCLCPVSEPGESIGLQIKGKVQFPFFSCSVLKPFCES